jgi:hypothetical protein
MAEMKYMVKNGKKYKVDNDGEKYRISWSEELQLKNLRATKELTAWQKRNFYVKVLLLLVFAVSAFSFMYILYRLDAVNFFSTVMYK